MNQTGSLQSDRAKNQFVRSGSTEDARAIAAEPTGDAQPVEIVTRPLPRVEGYRIVREIGHGGMGEVYEAVDEILEKTYALKMIRSDRTTSGFLNRFRREAKTMLELDHPHITRIFAYGETADGPFFTMKFFPDGTLEQRKQKYVASADSAVPLIIDIADAVAYLHSKGYVHRDLKPQNVLFEGDSAFVSDFGLAKEHGQQADLLGLSPTSPGTAATDHDEFLASADTKIQERGGQSTDRQKRLTVSQDVLGTLPYMSPEQLRGEHDQVTPRSDIWALGVILYELICGQRPFDAPDKKTLSDLIGRVSPHEQLRGKRSIDPGLARIIGRCLAKDPNQRFESADGLAKELREWLHPAPPRRISNRWIYPLPIAVGILFALALLMPNEMKSPAIPATISSLEQAKQQQQRLRQVLAAGKAFSLIADKGWPATGQRVALAGRSGEALLEDGILRIDALGRSTLELIDDPGVDDFMLRVDVRQITSVHPQDTRIGIYLGRESFDLPRGSLQSFAEFHYSEVDAPNVANLGSCEFQFFARWRPHDAPSTAESFFANPSWRSTFPQKMENRHYVWRELAIAVGPSQIRCFLDANLVVSVPREYPRRWYGSLEWVSGAAPPMAAVVPGRAGVGLTVSRGSALFRNARIEPLPVE